jgi:uncharacterized membrane protein
MPEVIGVLCVLIIVLALALWLVGVPIYLLVRLSELGSLRERLARLERELAHERHGEAPVTVEPTPVPEAAPPSGEIKEHVRPAAPVRPERPGEAPPPRLPRRRPTLPPSPLAGIDLEAWIGKRGLGWLAVILLIFAAAFFIKQAFDSNLIGNLGRVALGVLAGAGLCVAGYLCHVRRYRVFSQMLTSAGIVLLYLTTFASFGYYALMPQQHAGLFFVLIVAQTVALAWLYDAPPIAIMAVIGGLLTPVLLHTGRDQYPALFTYLTVLNLGAVALVVLRRHWYAVGTVAVAGTQLLFWVWYAENYHPEKLRAALLFQGVLFALYLAPSFLHAALRRAASVEDLLRLLVNATVFTVAGYVLLDPRYHVWMGTFVVGVATVYAALGLLLSARNPADRRHLLVVVAATLGLVAMVFPIQARAAWIGLGWAVEGALLWWFGLRVRNIPLRAFGAILLALAVGDTLFEAFHTGHGGPFTVPLFNKYGLPATLIALCVLFCAAVSRLVRPRTALDEVGLWVAGVGGVLLLWFIVSFESYDWFMQQIDRRAWRAQPEDIARLESYARLSLSVVWALYAAIILTVGFLRQNRPLRWTSLGIFGVTLLKVVFVDMAGLAGYYRIAAFFALSVMMALGAWIYQRIQFTQSGGEAEGVRS